MLRHTLVLSLAFLAAPAADDWGAMAVISATMGIHPNRLCLGEASRGDIGCPTYAPSLSTAGHVSVTGSLSAAKFLGDGSGLSNLPVAGVPVGAVMAFDLAACPAGWSEYTPARGRFLRGIDNGAGNDPDGTRTVGSLQGDANRSHSHTASTGSAGSHSHLYTNANVGTYPVASDMAIGHADSGTVKEHVTNNNSSTGGGGDHTHTVTVNADGAAEARPKNVAVLFCRKT